jgi:hypothetical protein
LCLEFVRESNNNNMKMELFRNRSASKKKKNKERLRRNKSDSTPSASPASSKKGDEETTPNLTPTSSSAATREESTSRERSEDKVPASVALENLEIRASPKTSSAEDNDDEDTDMAQIVQGVAAQLTPRGSKSPSSSQYTTPSKAPTNVDMILDSDEDEEGIFIADDEEDDSLGMRGASTWADETSGAAFTEPLSPMSAMSAPTTGDAMSKPSPATMMPRNAAAHNAIAAANRALACAVPGGFVEPSVLLTSVETTTTGVESDGSGADAKSHTSDEDSDDKKSGHGSDSAEDYTDDEDEGEDGYKPGGYHRVKVGEVYNQR